MARQPLAATLFPKAPASHPDLVNFVYPLQGHLGARPCCAAPQDRIRASLGVVDLLRKSGDPLQWRPSLYLG